MGFELARCICENCIYVGTCEYFKEVVEPIAKVVDTMIVQDEFTSEIIHALRDFNCEYFE